MTWIIFAIFGYALLAVESVISKYLLAGRIKSWQLYTFYIGLFSSFIIILSPFGLQWRGVLPFSITFISGLIFYLALAFLFQALICSSTERVYILYGAGVSAATLLLSIIFLGDKLTASKMAAVILLIIGGFFISFKFYRQKFFSNWQKTLLAAVLSAISWIMLKYSYDSQNFVSGYVFNRLGIFAGAVFSLALPSFRKVIIASWREKKRKDSLWNLLGTIAAKTLAGVGALLINYAVFLGSIAVVSALVSIQYLLTFILTLALSLYFRKIFVQHKTWQNIFSKIAGIALITAGTMLVFL